ncbi:MAG: hypothetical protein J5929_10435 [Eubacterium sp.]|nr:hypothetical protein [Eubacterium sp.]
MIYNYQECLGIYGSDYRIKKEISDGNLFVKEKGIYSSVRNTSETDVIMKKYPKTVFTGRSAFYYHSLTDVIPDHYYLASRRMDTRIKDPRVVQSFMMDSIFENGIIEMNYNDSIIRIYNRERMLIELVRFKAKLPLDYYKEIIQNYRKLIYELDFSLVEEYSVLFKNGDTLMNTVQMEVL